MTTQPIHNNYIDIRKDLNINRYVNSTGTPLYVNGVTYISGDLVVQGGKIRGSVSPILNDTGATVSGVTAGHANATNAIDVDNIFNGTGATDVGTNNTISFQNPTGAVNSNLTNIANLTMTGNLTVTGTQTFTGDLTTHGNLIIDTTGKGITIQGGVATDTVGQVTLVAGTVNVLNTNITAADRIFVTRLTAGGVIGFLKTTITPGASFDITSVDATGVTIADTSIVNYLIIRQV